jgi:hypothetical protein
MCESNSRRSGFFVTVAPEKLASQELDTSVETSGPHDFTVRVSAVRHRHRRVHRILPQRDGQRPSTGQDSGGYEGDLLATRTGIFLQRGLDSHIQKRPVDLPVTGRVPRRTITFGGRFYQSLTFAPLRRQNS